RTGWKDDEAHSVVGVHPGRPAHPVQTAPAALSIRPGRPRSSPETRPVPVSMRFTISREKLQEGLGAVAASIPAKTTLPVLANILVETTDNGIRLSGTDLDIAVSTEVQADVETAGSITILAKKLSEIARE